MRRLRALPEATQRLALLAAADPAGDATLLWRAAETLGINTEAVAPAQSEQLLEVGASVRFRHPLVRSATYRASPLPERRAVHMALAAATDPQLDPDRRAWHLAVAASGPDEDVAAELERSAGRAQARGGLAAAAALLERSVALTRDPERRTERALAAARTNLHAGAFDAALALLAAADAGPLDELQGARVELLRGQIASAVGRGERGVGSAAQGRQATRAAGREPGAGDLSRRVGCRALRRPPRPGGRQPARGVAGGEGRTPARRSRSVRLICC